MRTIFRNIFFFVAVISALLLTACGGGSSDPVINNGGNPVSPKENLSNEALAVKDAVTPVLQNAKAILNGGAVDSFRFSTDGNTNELSNNEIGNAVIKTLEAPKLLRAVITAAGGNIDGGLWENEERRGRCEIATFSNGIYERSVYLIDKEIISQLSPKELQEVLKTRLISHSIIDGCEADLRQGILYGIVIKPNAKISVEVQPNGNHKHIYFSFKGTINTDLTVKWIEPKVENLNSSNLVISLSGEEVTTDYALVGIKVSSKTIGSTVYTFSYFNLNLSEIVIVDYDKYFNKQINKEYKSNINICINGMKGSISSIKSIYAGKMVFKQEDQWVTQDYYNNDDFFVKTITEENNLELTAPVKISVTGDAYDTYADIGEKINTANIKNVSVIINKLTKPASGKLEDYIVDDAEAHVEVEASAVDPVLMIGNLEIAFCKAKIDVTGLKYNYAWDIDEGLSSEEFANKCFGYAKAHFEAEETKNSVTIKADCYINDKTAYLNLVNNSSYIVRDNTSEDNILDFNFKTLDIKASNVEVFINNKCEGAILDVKGVEKDGTISERTYKIVNGKLVLQKSDDKKTPGLPKVELSKFPEGLEANSNSIEIAVTEGKPNKTIQPKNSEGTLNVGSNGDLKVASYDNNPKNGKKIETKISAKNKIIAVVAYYGNKEFTLVFVIDLSDDESILIKGSIFKGKMNNTTMDCVENRIGQFAGKNGKITVITSEGASEFSVH